MVIAFDIEVFKHKGTVSYGCIETLASLYCLNPSYNFVVLADSKYSGQETGLGVGLPTFVSYDERAGYNTDIDIHFAKVGKSTKPAKVTYWVR